MEPRPQVDLVQVGHVHADRPILPPFQFESRATSRDATLDGPTGPSDETPKERHDEEKDSLHVGLLMPAEVSATATPTVSPHDGGG